LTQGIAAAAVETVRGVCSERVDTGPLAALQTAATLLAACSTVVVAAG
jgi:hypothetical protein